MRVLILIAGLLGASCAAPKQLGYVIVESNGVVDVWTCEYFTVTDTAIYIMNTDTIR